MAQTSLQDGRIVYDLTPAFLSTLRDTNAVLLGEAFSRIELTQGPILLFGGEDDQMWPSGLFAKTAMDRLTEKRHPFNNVCLCYSNAGHSTTHIPGRPTTEAAIYHPLIKRWLNMGGTPEGIAAGQRDAWTKTIQFLHQSLLPSRNSPMDPSSR